MMGQHGATEESNRLDRTVALTLRACAYAAFALASLGLVLELLQWGHANSIVRAAIVFLLITPVVRIIVLTILFLREGDRKHALIAVAVLAILIGSAVLGIQLE